MLATIGALLIALPIVLVPAMKLALVGHNPPRVIRDGLLAQIMVVLLLCCLLVGVAIIVEWIFHIRASAVPFGEIIVEVIILIGAIVVGAFITLLTQRDGRETKR